ncbi:hypothetical protein TNCV_323971 [Trichonephila clavipes]|nr:hypothetical protein TNCV_323971 [Trichonephila clavipes]
MRSRDEEETRAGTYLAKYPHFANGRTLSRYRFNVSSSTWRIFNCTRARTYDTSLTKTRQRPLDFFDPHKDMGS